MVGPRFSDFQSFIFYGYRDITNEAKDWVIELCHGSYQNPWYLVKKSTTRKYQLVNVAVKLNQVTVRDANLPLSANKVSEKFADCAISTFINFLLDYN